MSVTIGPSIEGVNGRELWRSNGTAAGTFDLTSDAVNGIQDLLVLGGDVLFSKDDFT